MSFRIIAVPYAAGRFEEGMGAGPPRYLQAGADRLLIAAGHDVDVATVGPTMGDGLSEPEAMVVVDTALAAAVAGAVEAGRFPLVLAGDCNSCLGTLAGLRISGTGDGLGVVWCDAHGDLNTPQTTASGYFDGMGLAIATGRSHGELARRLGLEEPVAEASVLHLGARDLDPPEAAYLEKGPMLSVSAAALQGERGDGGRRSDGGRRPTGDSLQRALEGLRRRTSAVYLHIDIDVLRLEDAPGVLFPVPGGLALAELEEAVRTVARSLPVRAAALTAFHAQRDREDLTLASGLSLMTTIAAACA